MEEKVYYLILSRGCYSDYSPDYYYGKFEITQKQLDERAKEVCIEVYKKYDSLPLRKKISCKYYHEHASYCSDGKEDEKFIPETGKSFSPYKIEDWFWEDMKTWVKEQGFEELPKEIPEINIEFSDLPYDKDGNPN